MGMQENHFRLIIPCTMDVNARHVNDYIRDAIVYVPITQILYRTAELGLHFMRIRWPVIDTCDGMQVVAQWD